MENEIIPDAALNYIKDKKSDSHIKMSGTRNTRPRSRLQKLRAAEKRR